MDQMRQDYGDYTADIIEGRQDDEISVSHESDIENVRALENTLLLGASNCKKLGVFDDNIINVSISGSTLDNIEEIVSKAKSIGFESNKCIDNIVVCLGTNDVTRNRTDPDEVNINVTHAINCVKLAFPDVIKKIGICSILPRKGKGQNITRLNETTKTCKFIHSQNV
ncbi:MAG: hypothetical protein NZ824_02795 [Candidatus Thioglobus sp.]|nr:hypothetical protein [Candidatus Thioglobus sp.]